MNRARRVTLLLLALLVVAFVATWLSIPSDERDAVPPPASLIAAGLTETSHRQLCIDFEGTRCVRFVRTVLGHSTEVDALKQRTLVVFGGAAAVIVLVGLAFGAARRE